MILQVCFLLYAILTPIVNAMGFTNPNNNAQWRQWDKNGGLDNLRRFFGVYAGNTPSRNNYQQFEPVSKLGYEALKDRGFAGMVNSYLDEVLDDEDDFIPYEFIRWLLQTAPHEDARAISELHQELATYPEVAIKPCFTQSVCDTDIDVMFVVDLTYRAVDILNDGIERNERIKTAFDNYYDDETAQTRNRRTEVTSFGWEFGWNFEAKADILKLLGISVPNSNAAGTGGVNGKLGFTFVNKVGIYVAGGSGLSRVGTVFDYQFGPAIGVEVVGGVFNNPPFAAQLEKLSATWTRSSKSDGDNFLQFQYIVGTTTTLDASLRVNGPTPAYLNCMAGDYEQQIDHEPIVSASCRNSDCDASAGTENVGQYEKNLGQYNHEATLDAHGARSVVENAVSPMTRVYTRNCNKKARVVDTNIKIQGEEHTFSDGFFGEGYIRSLLTRETESNVVLLKVQESQCWAAQGAEWAKAAYDIGTASYVTSTQDNQGAAQDNQGAAQDNQGTIAQRTDTTASVNNTNQNKYSSKDSQTFLMSSENKMKVAGFRTDLAAPVVKTEVYGTAAQSDLDDWDGDVMEGAQTNSIVQSRSRRAAPLNVIPSSAFADSTAETLVAIKRIKSKFPTNMMCQMVGKGGPTALQGLRSQLPYPLQFKAGFEVSRRVGEMTKSHVKFNLDDERDTLTYNGKNPTKYSLSEAIPTCSTPPERQIKQTTLVNFNGNIYQGSECVQCPMGKSAKQVSVTQESSLNVHTKFNYTGQWSLPYIHAYIFPLGFCSDPENVAAKFKSKLVDIDSVTGLSTTKFKHKFCCIDNILWPGKCIKDVPNICLDCASGSVPNGVFGNYDHDYNLVGEDVRGCHTCRAGKYSSWGRCDLPDSNGQSPNSTRNRWNCGLDQSKWISGGSNGSCSDGFSTSPDTCERSSAMFGTCKHQFWEPSTYTPKCADGSGRNRTECELTDYRVLHNFVCSDSRFYDETDCESNGVCSDSRFYDETTCESNGVCSDSRFYDETTCESNGVCSDSRFTDKTTCERVCSDSTFTDETTCESNGVCSDSRFTDETNCIRTGVCSDSISITQSNCEGTNLLGTAAVWFPAVWLNHTWSDNTWSDNTWSNGIWSVHTWSAHTYKWTANTWSVNTYTWSANTWSVNTWLAYNTWTKTTYNESVQEIQKHADNELYCEDHSGRSEQDCYVEDFNINGVNYPASRYGICKKNTEEITTTFDMVDRIDITRTFYRCTNFIEKSQFISTCDDGSGRPSSQCTDQYTSRTHEQCNELSTPSQWGYCDYNPALSRMQCIPTSWRYECADRSGRTKSECTSPEEGWSLDGFCVDGSGRSQIDCERVPGTWACHVNGEVVNNTYCDSTLVSNRQAWNSTCVDGSGRSEYHCTLGPGKWYGPQTICTQPYWKMPIGGWQRTNCAAVNNYLPQTLPGRCVLECTPYQNDCPWHGEIRLNHLNSKEECESLLASQVAGCVDNSGRNKMDCSAPLGTFYCDDGSKRSEQDCVLGRSTWLSPTCDDGSGRSAKECRSQRGIWYEGVCEDGSGRNKEQCEWPGAGEWVDVPQYIQNRDDGSLRPVIINQGDKIHFGKASCIDCPAGRYQTSTGQLTCQQCSTGQYQNMVGMQECKTCPLGWQSLSDRTTCKPQSLNRWTAQQTFTHDYGKDSNGNTLSVCNTTGRLQKECFCNYNSCEKDEFCDLDTSECYQTCDVYHDSNHTKQNQDICGCGDVTCDTTKFCDADTSRCLDHDFCSSDDGSTTVAQTCTCGTSECSNGEYCHADTSRCLTNPICSSTDGSTAVTQSCTCGEKTCVSGQYCDTNVCKWVIQSACKQCDSGKYNFDLRQVGGCQAGHSFNGVTSITQTLTASGGFVDQSNSKIANDGRGEITYNKRGWCKDGSGRSEQDCTRDKSEFIGCSDGSARSEWQCKQPSSSWLLQCDDRSGRSETDCTRPRSTWDVTCADSYCADGSGRSEKDCILPKSSYGIFSDGLTPSYGAVTPSQIQKQADGRVYFEICADGSGRPPETCNIPPSHWVQGCCADGSGRPKIDCLRPPGNWGLCADGSGRTKSECALGSAVFSAKCTNAAYNTKTSCENAGDSWLSGCVDGSGRSRQNCEIPRSHWEILNPLFYGHDEQCMYTGGNIENPIGCQCGAIYCDGESGLFCDGHACRPYGQCLFSNGERMNSGDCLCGNNDCSIGTGLFCKNDQCSHTNVDNTCSKTTITSGENPDACKCGSKTCNGVTGLYCNATTPSYCQRYPACQSPNNGVTLQDEKCECENSGNICNQNQYCHSGTCSDFTVCSNNFDVQMGSEVACTCGTKICTLESGLFCHDTDDNDEGDTCSPYELCGNVNGTSRNEPSSAWTDAHAYMNPNIETTFDMVNSHVQWKCFCPRAVTSIMAKYDDDPTDTSLEQACGNSLSENDVELGEWKNTDGSVNAKYPYCYKNDVCSYYQKCNESSTVDNFPKNDNYISESDTLSGNSDGSGWPQDDEACTCGAIICSDNLRMINGGRFSYGHFCNADYKTNGQPTCTNIPVCTSNDGTYNHTGSGHCICSDKVKCSPGQYCDTANHRCSNYPNCIHQDGTQQNTAECICGKQLDTVCKTNQYCYGATSSCSSASGIHDNDYYFTTEDTCEKDGYRTLRDHNPDFVADEMRCADASRAIALRGEERRLASTLTPKADPYWFVSSQQGAFYIKDEDTPPGCWWNGVRGNVYYNPLSLASEMTQTNLCTSGDSNGCLCQFAQPICQNTDGSAPNDGPCWCWDKPCTAKTGLVCDVQQHYTTFVKKGTCSSTTSNCNDPAVYFQDLFNGVYKINPDTRCRCNQVTCYGGSPYTTERLGDIGAGKYCNWEASICSEQRIYDCVTQRVYMGTVAGHCSDPEYTTKSSCIRESNGFCSDLRALTKSRCEITFREKWTLNTWVDSYSTFLGGMCKCADSICTTATGFNCNGAGLCSHSDKFTVYKEITGATYCGDPNGIGKDLEYILDYGECQKAITNIQTPLVKGTDYDAMIQPRALGAKAPSLYSGTTSTGDSNTMTRGCSLGESASYNTYYLCDDFSTAQSQNNWKCSNSALNQLGANAPSYYGSTPDSEICRYGNCNTNLPAGVHPEDYAKYTEDGYPICNPGTYISDVEYACNPSTPDGLRHVNSGWNNGGRQSSWVKGSPGCRHETDDGNGCQTSYVSTYGAAVGHNIFIYGDKWENLKLKVTEDYDVEKTRVTTNTHLNPGYTWHQYDLIGYVGKTTATYSRVSKAFCSYTGTVCGNIDGTVKNSGTCVCGTTVCNSHTGLWCYADQSLCIPALYPVVTSGNCTSWGYENIADKATCSAGAKQVGWSATTASTTYVTHIPSGCSRRGSSLFFNTNAASTTSCSSIYSTPCLCVFERPACANGDGITANSVPCVCGTAACTNGTGLICASASNTCSKTITAVLVVVKEGTCSTEGYEYIADSTACEAAAAQIGWSDTTADTNEYGGHRPRGCYDESQLYTNVKHLKFNTDTTSHRVCDNSNACVCSFTGPTCVNGGGVTANSIPCVCGTTACTSATGLKCNAATSTCSA